MKRRFYGTRSSVTVAALAIAFTCAAASIPWIHPAAAKAPVRSAPGRVLVVTANVHETDYWDVFNARDLRVFVRRMFNRVPRLPDAVVLQELWGHSASKVAKIMTRKSPDRYVVAVGAANPPWRQPNATHVVGTDSAIVVNTRTMSVGGGGYIRLGYKTAKAAPNREVRVKRHPYALVRERRSNFAIPLVSVHFPKAEHFVSTKAGRRVKAHWIRRLNRQLGRAFPRAAVRTSRVIAGDLNNPRCERNKPLCTLTPAYRTATRRLGYRDSVTALHGWSNPIDFILSKAPVVSSGFDIPAAKPRNRYSDHVFRWALLEKKDRTAPSAPGRISRAKGTHRYVRLRGWNKARDGGTGFAHFNIRKSRKGPGRGFYAVGRTRKTTFKDRNVRRGREYWYRVVALDRAGNPSRTSPVVHVRAGERPPKRRHEPKKDRKGPAVVDLPIKPVVGEQWLDGLPPFKGPHIDRPQMDPPPDPNVHCPGYELPEATLEPPPIKPWGWL